MEIVVGGKSSRVPDAIPELNLERLEPIVERIVKRIVGAPRGLKTIRELAQANGIGLTLAYEELNAGRLEAIKVGSKNIPGADASTETCSHSLRVITATCLARCVSAAMVGPKPSVQCMALIATRR
jgi:hypothetical protein